MQYLSEIIKSWTSHTASRRCGIIAREHRERHVNRGDEHGAQHVRCEQRKVRPVIGEENGERPSCVVHGTSVAEKRARGEMRREDNDRAAADMEKEKLMNMKKP